MEVKDISLSWITVKDPERTKKFLNSLGLNLVKDNPEFGWMEYQGQNEDMRLGIAKSSPEADLEHPPGTKAVITFLIKDIEKCKEELKKSEASLMGDIVEVPNIVKLLMFRDPDGNKFQLVENLEDK